MLYVFEFKQSIEKNVLLPNQGTLSRMVEKLPTNDKLPSNMQLVTRDCNQSLEETWHFLSNENIDSYKKFSSKNKLVFFQIYNDIYSVHILTFSVRY